MITKPTQKRNEIKTYALTSPTIASIAGKIMAGSLDVTAREVVVLAASALAQAGLSKTALKPRKAIPLRTNSPK